MSLEEAQVLSLGYSLEQATAALAACGNDVAQALIILNAQCPLPGEEHDASPTLVEEAKMVLCVRTDLSMGVGKMCSQCSHAAVDCVLTIQNRGTAQHRRWLAQWLDLGCAKIVLRVDGGEGELHRLQSAARGAGLPTAAIKDAGRTQVAPGSATVLAIGPGPKAAVDSVTGALKLLLNYTR